MSSFFCNLCCMPPAERTTLTGGLQILGVGPSGPLLGSAEEALLDQAGITLDDVFGVVLSAVFLPPLGDRHQVLSQLPPEVPVRIFRDLYVYVPPERRFEVHVRWRATEWSDIEESQPDLVLLRRSMIEQYADPASVAASTDAEGALRAHHFHRDARDDRIPGYRRLFASDFAVAFGRAAPAEPGGGAAANAPLP